MRIIGLRTSQSRGKNRERQKSCATDTGMDKKCIQESVHSQSEARLRKLKVTHHKKLLVPLDSDKAWFQQVLEDKGVV